MLFVFVACVFLLCDVRMCRMCMCACTRACVVLCVFSLCCMCVCSRVCVYVVHTRVHTQITQRNVHAQKSQHTHTKCQPTCIYAPNACEHTRAGTLVCTHTYNTARHTHTTHAHITKLEHTHAFTHQRKRSFSTTSRPNTAF